ncbi:hypothetical protein [Mesorhizobium sp. 1M-11]|uniref:hypothetical protein n=1 Tax=Mesorhizobium sp. 1M-11 TaxID=1529006 RepID=UPI0006C767C5|nr:hypothetical protein [Mesorhizobium sp. 1M-11]
MKRSQKFIIIPFRSIKGRFHVGEMRPASSEGGAVRIAELMAERFAGAAAFEVHVDEESGEMFSPRLIASFGKLPDLEEAMRDAA